MKSSRGKTRTSPLRPKVMELETRDTPSYTPASLTFDTNLTSLSYTSGIGGTDNGTTTVSLGANNFNFYGTNYTSVILSTNGLIAFGSAVDTGGGTDAANVALSVTPSQGVIAPLWDDWTNSATSPMVSYTTSGSQFIVRWNALYSNAVPSVNRLPVEFYAVLNLNTSAPGTIDFHYASLTASNNVTFSGPNGGGQATVGVKRPGVADSSPNETETRTLIAFNSSDTVNGTSSALMASNQAIRLSWTNVAPTISTSNITLTPTTLNEGGTVSLDATFNDPNDIDPHTVTINWGDGTANDTFVLSTGVLTFSGKTHKYADNPTGQPTGSYTISVTVQDATLSGNATKNIQVNNVAPVISAGSNATINEGALFTRTVTFTDVSVDGSYTATVDYGDGRGQQALSVTTVSPGNYSLSLSNTYPDDDGSPYTVTVQVTDKDGGLRTATFTVTANNVAPVLNSGSIPNLSTNEGTTVTILPTLSDVGFQNLFPAIHTFETFTYEVDWGDGTSKNTGAATITGIGSAGTPTQGNFTESHVFADNGTYTVTIKLTDDDGGVDTKTFTVTVANVAPTLTVPANGQTATEGTLISFPTIGQFTDPGFTNAPLTEERFFYTIDWGDGTGVTSNEATTVTQGTRSPLTLTSGSFAGSHTYADNGTYTVTVALVDDNGGTTSKTFTVIVSNSNPILTVPSNTAGVEGSLITFSSLGSFTDLGFDNLLNPGSEKTETFTYSVDWGDGFSQNNIPVSNVVNGSAGTPTTGVFANSHIYADNGTYTVTVTVNDDDSGSNTKTFTVTIANASPTLTVVSNQTRNEGQLLSLSPIATFTDPGFDNALNPGSEKTETFTYTVDWGDGTSQSSGTPTWTTGSSGVATTGSFNGSHTYADNGVYTVTVTVNDDDGGSDVKTFQVTVNNVAPTLAVVPNQNRTEGQLLSIVDIGTFTDPGFDNPLNAGQKTERFTYSINWGDGTSLSTGNATIDTPGAIGTPTSGSFDGAHTYADNGTYTVSVTVTDDDGGTDTKTFTVTVSNVPPTLTAATNQTINEGALLTVSPIGTFTDPGFDNLLNPGADKTERFTYSINWGDGTAPSTGSASITTPGSVGVPTAGSFSSSHTYADNGTYTVSVTLTDDNGGQDIETFIVTINNVAPTLTATTDKTVNEGALLSITNIGTFTDPGYDNSVNPGVEKAETFTYSIDWGDGRGIDTGNATRTSGSAGVLTTGAFNGSHTYADNGTYTVTLIINDDDGGSDTKTFTVTVNNVAPGLTVSSNVNGSEGIPFNFAPIGTFDDPGFDNPVNPGAEKAETFTYSIDWGDGASSAGVATATTGSPGVLTQGSIPASHTYADNGTFLISVTVSDDDGGSVTRTFQAIVANDAPVLTVPGSQSVPEGTAINLVGIGSFTDKGYSNPGGVPPTAETFTYSINWGDGHSDIGTVTSTINGASLNPTQGSFDGNHTYADNGVYTVAVTVVDDDGGQQTKQFTITVSNVAPSLALGLTSPLNANEGAAITPADSSFSDPGFANPLNPGANKDETFTATIDWGDGVIETKAVSATSGSVGVDTTGAFGWAHTYKNQGTYLVTQSVTDDDGGVSNQVTFTVIVDNVAPSNLTVNRTTANLLEGSAFQLFGTFTDPGVLDAHTVLVQWGDGTANTVSTLAANVTSYSNLSHTYIDNGAYTITVRVTDDVGGFVESIVPVSVANVAPQITVPDHGVGYTFKRIQFTVNISDAGVNDAPQLAWTVVDPNNTVISSGTGTTITFLPNHSGTLLLNLTATDKDGGVTTQTAQYIIDSNELLAVSDATSSTPVVVYNPELTERFRLDPFPGIGGGYRVGTMDLTGDGLDDIVVGSGVGGGPTLALFDGATGTQFALLNAFPFDSNFEGGVFVSGGDIDGDGFAELVVSADQGGGAVVAIYRGADLVNGNTNDWRRFFGIRDESFRGGARVAVGDVDGDGHADVAVAAGFLGGPRVSLWDGQGLVAGQLTAPSADFFAFESSLRNGCFIALADMDGDNKADFLFAGGPGGGPRVRVASGVQVLSAGNFGSLDSLPGLTFINFFAGDPATTSGIRITAADLDEDGRPELITGSGAQLTPEVQVYHGSSLTTTPSLMATLRPFDPALLFGVFVG